MTVPARLSRLLNQRAGTLETALGGAGNSAQCSAFASAGFLLFALAPPRGNVCAARRHFYGRAARGGGPSFLSPCKTWGHARGIKADVSPFVRRICLLAPLADAAAEVGRLCDFIEITHWFFLCSPLEHGTAASSAEPSAGSLRLMIRNSLGKRVMNNFSLLGANRLVHLKVVMLALACATLVAGIGLVHSALQQVF